MSELICKTNGHANVRWNLLAGASLVVLASYAASSSGAAAQDSDRPTVWIDLGAQWSRLEDSTETLSPDFLSMRPSIFSAPDKLEHAPRGGFEENGAILFQPESSPWQFSASVRYGRSQGNKQAHQQTYPNPIVKYYSVGGEHRQRTAKPIAGRFADTQAKTGETHLIADFQSGKDVGLGLFGRKDASSVVSVGVRFAQFTSRSNVTLRSNPDWHFAYKSSPFIASYFHFTRTQLVYGQPYHSNLATLRAERSFSGLGPSISWNASVPFVGNAREGELNVDFGFNAAVLFGRQKAETHHQTTQRIHSAAGFFTQPGLTTVYQHPDTPDHKRSRGATVPNIGGFAGLSFKYPHAKVSFGYRADFFFGAMDGGIDERHTENLGFNGPFASVSIGLGG